MKRTMIVAIASAPESTVADALAEHLALHGRKVYLIDTASRHQTRSLSLEIEQLLSCRADILIRTGITDTLDNRAALIAARIVLVPTAAAADSAVLNTARMFNPALRVLQVPDAAPDMKALCDAIYNH